MMKSRRQAVIIFTIAVTVALLFYTNNAASRPFSVSLWTKHLTGEHYKIEQKSDNMIPENWSHPSVFQQWRDHQPPRHVHAVPKECARFREFKVQLTCSKRLQHVKDFCSRQVAKVNKKDSEEDKEIDGNGEGDRQADFGGTNEKDLTDLTDLTDKEKSGADDVVPRDGDTDKYSDSTNNDVVDVFHYRQRRRVVMHCSVHKVASTFWISVFRFMNNDTDSRFVSSPEHISKYTVHLTPFNRSRPLALAYLSRKLQPGDQQFRFMFTRDPYQRLWSVYVDKFVLPDFYFWSYHAIAIKEQASNDSEQHRKSVVNQCPEVSFAEFVRYVVQSQSSPTAHRDDHLFPVSTICNPCVFDPNFIGRTESMMEDSETVLGFLNLKHLFRKKNFETEILSQMRTITNFVYDTVIDRGNLRQCVTHDQLQTRLLKAFVLKGYLPPHVNTNHRPPLLAGSRSSTLLFNVVKHLFLSSNRTQREVDSQRKRFFVQAYRSLPWVLLLKVRDYYARDFEAFGYDSQPSALFADRKTASESGI